MVCKDEAFALRQVCAQRDSELLPQRNPELCQVQVQVQVWQLQR